MTSVELGRLVSASQFAGSTNFSRHQDRVVQLPYHSILLTRLVKISKPNMATEQEAPGAASKSKRFIPLGTSSSCVCRVSLFHDFSEENGALANHFYLENNPEVMSNLVHKLGLSSKLGFHDVFSIDEPELLAFVPRPAAALLLLFPVSSTYEKFRRDEDENKEEYTGSGDGEEVIWYKQTIGNACGLIGLLHAVSNGHARSQIGTTISLSA